jgi:hypothetical protein
MLVNGDPLNPANWPPANVLRAFGFGGVRVVSRRGIEAQTAAVQAEGLFVLAVVTEQSGGYLLPSADLTQIGNEPDIGGTADSMDPPTFTNYLRLYRDTYPDLPMITGGLASGDYTYLQRVRDLGGLQGFSGVAVHYPANATILGRYRNNAAGLPLYVTEWNTSADRILAYRAMLAGANVALDCWFSWNYSEWALTASQARALLA